MQKSSEKARNTQGQAKAKSFEEKIAEVVLANPGLSPERLRNHFQVLDEQQEPILTLQEARGWIERVRSKKQNLSAVETPPPRAVERMSTFYSEPQTESPASIPSPQSLFAAKDDTTIISSTQRQTTPTCVIIHNETRLRWTLADNENWDKLSRMLQFHFKLTNPVLALVGQQAEDQVLVTSMPLLGSAVADGLTTFSILVDDMQQAAETTKGSGSMPLPAGMESTRATEAPSTGILSMATWAHNSNQLRQYLKTPVDDTLMHLIPKFGAVSLTCPEQAIMTFAAHLAALQVKWKALQNPVPLPKEALADFVAHILVRADPSLQAEWAASHTFDVQEPPESFEAFAREVFVIRFPGTSGDAGTMLSRWLAELPPRLATFPKRAAVVSALRQTLHAVRFIHAVIFPPVEGSHLHFVPDPVVTEFFETRLAPQVLAELKSTLQLLPASLARAAPTTDPYALWPLTFYKADAVLGHWARRDDLYAHRASWLSDFKQLAPLSGVAATGTRPPPPHTTPTASATASTPGLPPSAEPAFTLRDPQGQRHTFPYNLVTVQDLSERQTLKDQYLKCATGPDRICEACRLPGHIARVCPKRTKLDARGFESRPNNFFYKLQPPRLDAAGSAPVGGRGRDGPVSQGAFQRPRHVAVVVAEDGDPTPESGDPPSGNDRAGAE